MKEVKRAMKGHGRAVTKISLIGAASAGRSAPAVTAHIVAPALGAFARHDDTKMVSPLGRSLCFRSQDQSATP